jgi:hypothetical protein
MFEDKQVVRVGGNVVERYRKPSNPKIANNMTQYIHDYKTFQKLTPDSRKGSLVEAGVGPSGSRAAFQSINPSTNGSICFGPSCHVDLGGSPDEPGRF